MDVRDHKHTHTHTPKLESPKCFASSTPAMLVQWLVGCRCPGGTRSSLYLLYILRCDLSLSQHCNSRTGRHGDAQRHSIPLVRLIRLACVFVYRESRPPPPKNVFHHAYVSFEPTARLHRLLALSHAQHLLAVGSALDTKLYAIPSPFLSSFLLPHTHTRAHTLGLIVALSSSSSTSCVLIRPRFIAYHPFNVPTPPDKGVV